MSTRQSPMSRTQQRYLIVVVCPENIDQRGGHEKQSSERELLHTGLTMKPASSELQLIEMDWVAFEKASVENGRLTF